MSESPSPEVANERDATLTDKTSLPGAADGRLGVAVSLLSECLGPLEVSAATIESEDGGDAIETLIEQVRKFCADAQTLALSGSPQPQPVAEEAERPAFERDAEPMGFDLTRHRCAAPEPWSQYEAIDTGNRWGGWLARAALSAPAVEPVAVMEAAEFIAHEFGAPLDSPETKAAHVAAIIALASPASPAEQAATQAEAKPVAYRAWFDQDNGARWLFSLWPEEERLDVEWQPLYVTPTAPTGAPCGCDATCQDKRDGCRYAEQAAPKAEPALTFRVARNLCKVFAESAMTAAECVEALDKMAEGLATPPTGVEGPVLYQKRMRPTWDQKTHWSPWEDCSKEAYEQYLKVPLLHDWAYEVRALCIAAQPVAGHQGGDKPAIGKVESSGYFAAGGDWA